MPRTFVTDCEGFHRRDFLKIGAGGLFGLTLPQLLRLEAQAAPEKRKQRANAVIMLWLGGGPSHLDMWDIKTNAPEGIRSQFKPISTHGGRRANQRASAENGAGRPTRFPSFARCITPFPRTAPPACS